MDKIGLTEAIATLRAELSQAVLEGLDQEIQFPVSGVQLEFQVVVTREAAADGRLKVWVLEVGTELSTKTESLHRVTLNLEPPVDAAGAPIKVRRQMTNKP